LLGVTALAEVPAKINYQGRLVDQDTGLPLGGTYEVVFRIFDAEVGGTAMWEETQSVTPDAEGVFAAVLGSDVGIDAALDGPVWLEVEVAGEVLTPRREIVSVPFALRSEVSDHASSADSLGGYAAGLYLREGETGVISAGMIMDGSGSGLDADMVDGMDADAFADSGHNHDNLYYPRTDLNTTGSINDTGNPVDWTRLKGVPSGFADGVDDVGGTGDGHSLDASDGVPADVVYVDEKGDVGIGNTNPTARVEVTGLTNIDAQVRSVRSGGATATFGAEVGKGVVGTNSSDALVLRTGGTDQILIDTQGDMGLGTVVPETPIHILRDTDSATGITIENPNTGASSVERLVFKNENGTLAGITAYDDDHPTHPGQMIVHNNRPDGELALAADGTKVVTLKDSNLGILQSDPTYRLDVNGIARVSGFRLPIGASSGYVLTSDPTGSGSWQPPSAVSDADWTVVGDTVYCDPASNVGIGTASPTQALHIRKDTNDFALIEIENRDTGVSSAEGILFRHEGGGTSKIACYDDGNMQYPGQMVIQSGKGSRQLNILTHTKTCLFADSSTFVGVGHTAPKNRLHVEGTGTDEGGVTGYKEVNTRLKTTGGQHSALSVDAIADRDAIIYMSKDGEAVWDIRNDADAGNSFQLRYHGGIALAGKYLTVDSTGKVGVGTTSPGQRLHVYEDMPGEVSYGLKLDNPSSTAMTSTGVLFKVDSGGSGRGKGAIVYERTDTWNRGDFHFLQNSAAGEARVALGDAVMTVRNNGNVGVGITNPSSQFEVQRDETSGRLGFFKISSSSNNGDVIRAETAGGGNALSGSSQNGRGVVGHSATDYAGYFTGDVYVTGSINKAACSFVMDHPLDPENKILRHNCVESPEHLLIYRGKVRLDENGEAAVEMPDYFGAVADEEAASIHLTPVGRPFPVGAEWGGRFAAFTVYGDPGREVFWEVLAGRDDPVIRRIAKPVEEDKGPENKICDRGRLLHPRAYGYPETMGQDYELIQGMTD